MYDLAKFKMSEMIECGSALRQIGTGAQSMEEVANRIVNHIHANFMNLGDGKAECSLVRFYKTHVYGELDRELQEYVLNILEQPTAPDNMKCLTLLATAGENPQWNSRKNSIGHKAIPLPDREAINLSPMTASLIQQFGLDVDNVIAPSLSLMVEMEQRSYNVFYVKDALGSPFVPAQDGFVIPYGIQSVIGFGGMLPDGNLFATIIFSRVRIPREAADMFKTLALNVKMAILPFVNGRIFS
ncbi:MAG TPA: hypothetical protein DET40_24625 [Lentisphaeria bacterium]|nr:MAG: hypothetical protein A2X45_22870 [Lentisphaerae bacterium GWF2_50_93]HCE46745.1 hypothetical protein [Lentisphaeria bacterium]